MKQKDIAILAGIGLIAAIISAVVAGKIFTSPSSRSTKVPVVAPISSTFPDVKNDSQYKTFFNSNGLDPTQLIKISPSQNQQPFSNSSQ
jgi:hypothetical protein